MSFTKKNNTTDVSSFVKSKNYNSFHSDYAYFHCTFATYNFLDNDNAKICRKSQIFWRNPKAAMQMAKNLLIPKRYTLVEYEPLISSKHAA
ncbi:hypothetical protein [Algibacter sp. PT7-4]|uniref:hypothetical protein n=1 Tax=Algibacter ulvanivorans TaxID=3400999 RepID=UPI003AAEC3BA